MAFLLGALTFHLEFTWANAGLQFAHFITITCGCTHHRYSRQMQTQRYAQESCFGFKIAKLVSHDFGLKAELSEFTKLELPPTRKAVFPVNYTRWRSAASPELKRLRCYWSSVNLWPVWLCVIPRKITTNWLCACVMRKVLDSQFILNCSIQ